MLETISKWGGELVEVPYTHDISSTVLEQTKRQFGTTPDCRLRMLRRLIENKDIVRVMEAHNGLTGLIVENTSIEEPGRIKEFDAIWLSSLTESTAKGKPDIEVVDLTSRMRDIHDICEVTTKPIIFDGDTGGITEHFVFMVRSCLLYTSDAADES